MASATFMLLNEQYTMPLVTAQKGTLRRTAKLVVLSLCALFSSYLHAGGIQNSEKDSLIREIKKLKSTPNFNATDTLYIELSNDLAASYRFLDSDSLYSISKNTLELSKKAKFPKGECDALYHIANYHSDKGEYKKAIAYYGKALVLAEGLQDNGTQLTILTKQSLDYSYLGEYAKALDGYLKGIDIAESTQNLEKLSILNEHIAYLYIAQEDLDQSLNYFLKVKKINEKIGNDLFSAQTLSNLASLYSSRKEYDYALFNINKSIITFKKLENYEWLAHSYGVKGEIYLDRKEYQWALHWYDESLSLHEELDDRRAKIAVLNGLAKANLALKNDSIAFININEAYGIAEELSSLVDLINCSETLYKVLKKRGKPVEALEYAEIFHKLSDSLSKDENQKSLALLETQLEYEKQKQELIIENERALAKQRNYIYAALIVLLVLGSITFFVYRSKKIQKRLYNELQEKSEVLQQRETELSAINKTRTKLFSIIGHDLRGPIGALQGLLNLFSSKEIGEKDFLSLVPKLKIDIDHIHFTLNNLLSWGQSQMNGLVTRPKAVSMEGIVDENINLLSEVANKKSIKVMNQLPENVLVWVDMNQIDIVVRNLISNALKFTPENGLITIEAEEMKGLWEISVRDTGVGMDEETMAKIFDSTTTHTSYGTNNEKGTGLGLSLCQEMVEKNGGSIWVESTLKKGSSFYFSLPKAKNQKDYKKAG